MGEFMMGMLKALSPTELRRIAVSLLEIATLIEQDLEDPKLGSMVKIDERLKTFKEDLHKFEYKVDPSGEEEFKARPKTWPPSHTTCDTCHGTGLISNGEIQGCLVCLGSVANRE